MKKVTAICLAWVLLFAFTACSSDEDELTSTSAQATATTIQTTTEETTAEVTTVKETTTEATTQAVDMSLKLGEKYYGTECEIVFNRVYTARKCTVRVGSGYSRYMQAGEGNTFVIVESRIKNTGISELSTWASRDIFDGYVIYDGKYSYEAESSFVGEDEILPLNSQVLSMVIEVPVEVANSEKSLDLFIKVGGEEYKYTVK